MLSFLSGKWSVHHRMVNFSSGTHLQGTRYSLMPFVGFILQSKIAFTRVLSALGRHFNFKTGSYISIIFTVYHSFTSSFWNLDFLKLKFIHDWWLSIKTKKSFYLKCSLLWKQSSNLKFWLLIFQYIYIFYCWLQFFFHLNLLNERFLFTACCCTIKICLGDERCLCPFW